MYNIIMCVFVLFRRDHKGPREAMVAWDHREMQDHQETRDPKDLVEYREKW